MADSTHETARPFVDDSRGRETRDERPKQRFEAFIPEALRRTVYAGIASIFTSEEGVRRLASDFSLPKDMVAYLIAQAQTSKNELFRIFAQEMRQFLETMRFNEELQRLLGSMTIELNTEIRFIPKDEGLQPTLGNSEVRVKRPHRQRPKQRSRAKPGPEADEVQDPNES